MRGLARGLVLSLEFRGERRLGFLLQQRIERAEYRETSLGQVRFLVVRPELPAHEIEERRVKDRALVSSLGDAERFLRGGLRFFPGDDVLLGQHAQHHVAASQRAVRMAARIVVRGPADDRNHGRNLRKAELRQRLAEVELAREAEAVDCASAVLPEINLVDIGVHDVRLLEATLEDDGHHRFLGLAPQRAPAVEEIALHQLLGQRAAALLDLPGAHVDEHRPQDRQRVDAVVAVELAVLDGLERLGQQRRHLVRGDDDPVLAVQRENAADQQRIEADDRNVRALRIGERGDRVAGEADPQRDARPAARPNSERPAGRDPRGRRVADRCPAVRAPPATGSRAARAPRRTSRPTATVRRTARSAARRRVPATSSAFPRTAA